MESHTLRSRLMQLAQKSRKALRLYQTMGRLNGAEPGELTDRQIEEWKTLNGDLLRELAEALELGNVRDLAARVFVIRDHFHDLWRASESRLHGLQRELITSAEHGDFVRSSLVSRELVVLKARTQASQAAHHELQDVIDRSRVAPQAQPPVAASLTQDAIPLDEDQVIEELVPESPLFASAKVIPIRKRS